MADTAGAEDPTVTFHVKSSGGQKYTLTLPLSTTTVDLKNKLATEEYANVPASAQRLIYSGRVLKDTDTLATHNVKEGNTMHLVKSAPSNQRQNPAAQASSTSNPTSTSTPQASGVPQNLASGTGNDPLAGLTGARYAGFAQLPNASMFQPQTPEDMMRQLEDPNFQQMMREAMNNPQVIDMMINSNPQLRALGPQARQMLQSDYFRRMMTDPQALRSLMQMQQAMGVDPFGGAGGGQGAFPAPGETNTTETRAPGSDTNGQAPQQPQQQPQNPFAALGGAGGMGNNPFASLFNPFPGATQNPTGSNDSSQNQPPDLQNLRHQVQHLGGLVDTLEQLQRMRVASPQANADGTSSPPPANPFAAQNNPLLQNPEALNQFMQAMGGGAGGEAGNLFDMFGGGRPQSPPDNRPPEERYATQLQQLNDMGFFDFDRNVQALRRSGGNVNGAIEYLLGNP